MQFDAVFSDNFRAFNPLLIQYISQKQIVISYVSRYIYAHIGYNLCSISLDFEELTFNLDSFRKSFLRVNFLKAAFVSKNAKKKKWKLFEVMLQKKTHTLSKLNMSSLQEIERLEFYFFPIVLEDKNMHFSHFRWYCWCNLPDLCYNLWKYSNIQHQP